MADWLSSMQQSFEYYTVDPGTWKDVKKIDTVKNCSISRDLEADTLGSASIGITDSLGECYIRAYLITIQNGVRERHPLGTFLVQTPSSSFNGKIRDVTMDAYTPLLELKENPPPLGYSVLKDANTMTTAYQITRDNVRAPVVPASCEKVLYNDFVSNTNDNWLTFVRDLIATEKYEFVLDELGRILFAPKQELDTLQPVWTYDDDNSSILYPDLSLDHDMFGVPNVVEVVYSKGTENYYACAVNDDENSPTSTVNRGRKITYRDTNPNISCEPTSIELVYYKVNYDDKTGTYDKTNEIVKFVENGSAMKNVRTKTGEDVYQFSKTIDSTDGTSTNETIYYCIVKESVQLREYANQLLKTLSTLEYTVTYTHGYCPVRIGDCVRLNYTRAGINNMKAKVISQSIKCEPGCPVTEKAVFTNKLWR